MNKTKEEIYYWNFIKTVAICLVVYCHLPLLNPSWYNNYSQLLTFIAVPLFFMVNGAALFSHAFDLKKHTHKMVHLFLITRVWRAIYFAFAVWRGMVDVAALSGVKMVTYFLGDSIKGVPSGPLWFIRSLLACYILFPVLKHAFDSQQTRRYLEILCVAMIVLMVLRQECLLWQEVLTEKQIISQDTAVSLKFLMQYNPVGSWAVLYFILGGLLHQRYYIEQKGSSRRKNVLFILAFLLASVWFFCIKGLIAGFSGTVFNDFSKYGIDGCYQSMAVLIMSGSFFMLSLNGNSKMKPFQNVIRLVGRNTLTIYFVHYMGAYLLKDSIPYFQNHAGIFCNGLKTIILIGVCLVVDFVIKKVPGVRKILI